VGIRPPYPMLRYMILCVVRYLSVWYKCTGSSSANVLAGMVCLYFFCVWGGVCCHMVVQVFDIMAGQGVFSGFGGVLRGVAMYVAISLLVDGCECEVSSHHVASGLECWVALVWKGFVLSCRTHKPFCFLGFVFGDDLRPSLSLRACLCRCLFYAIYFVLSPHCGRPLSVYGCYGSRGFVR